MIGEIFEATGTLDERGYYDNFGIVPQLRNIYGVKKEIPIYKIVFSVSDNQSGPNWNLQEYWGWFSFSNNKFIIIQPNFRLFNVCFPYGYKHEEEVNHGKAYRLEIKRVEKIVE